MADNNRYDPKESEKKWQEYWENESIYKFNEDTEKEIYSVDTPPPTISGRMHIGHAFSYTQADFIVRYKRMKGFEAFYPFGTDNNGLPTEKLVQKERKVNLRKVPREEAIQICNDFLAEERPKFIQDFKNIGLSCDFDLGYSTIDDHSRSLSQKTFLDLVKKDLIYRKEGPVMWDRVFQTPIAQAELEDVEIKSSMNYVKAKVVGSKDTYVIFATTRPELLFACAGMSVEDDGDYVKLKVGEEFWIISHKTYEENMTKFKIENFEVVEELKGQNLIGEKARIPITDTEIKITHDVAVQADFGTGIAYFCSYGGVEDIEYFARHNLAPIQVLNPDGRLNEKGGEFEGMISVEARPKVIKKLEEIGNLIVSDKITHMVNVGERSGVEVEYIVAKQWYVKYLDKKEYLFEMAQKFNWHPDFMKHRLENWIKGLNWDWGFSRQRHFGISIPVWYCDECGEQLFADESQLPVDTTKSEPLEACKCGSKKFTPETDIMDTWFTSGSSPFLAINLVKNEETRKKLFPMSLRPQAHDIINFWLFYTMAKTNLLFDENPFKDIMVSGWVLDPKGKKMSKSKGNTIAPQDIVDKFSNDALRYAAASTKLGQDIPFQEKECKAGNRLITKIWNASRFGIMHLENFDYKECKKPETIDAIDSWILSRLKTVTDEATGYFENYEFSKAKKTVEDMFWKDFCDYYLEIVKDRFYNPDNYSKEAVNSSLYTLYTAINSFLKLFSPYIPFVTESVYHLYFAEIEGKKSIHNSSWPEFDDSFTDSEAEAIGEVVKSVVGDVRRTKSDKKLSLKAPVKSVSVKARISEENFEKVKIDIKNAILAENISYETLDENSEEDFDINVDLE